MHDFLKIIGPKRELHHDVKSPSTLSHGVNKILQKLGEGGVVYKVEDTKLAALIVKS